MPAGEPLLVCPCQLATRPTRQKAHEPGSKEATPTPKKHRHARHTRARTRTNGNEGGGVEANDREAAEAGESEEKANAHCIRRRKGENAIEGQAPWALHPVLPGRQQGPMQGERRRKLTKCRRYVEASIGKAQTDLRPRNAGASAVAHMSRSAAVAAAAAVDPQGVVRPTSMHLPWRARWQRACT